MQLSWNYRVTICSNITLVMHLCHHLVYISQLLNDPCFLFQKQNRGHTKRMTCFSYIVTLFGYFCLFVSYCSLWRQVKAELCLCLCLRSPPAICSQACQATLSCLALLLCFLLLQCSAEKSIHLVSMNRVCVRICGCSDDPSFMLLFIFYQWWRRNWWTPNIDSMNTYWLVGRLGGLYWLQRNQLTVSAQNLVVLSHCPSMNMCMQLVWLRNYFLGLRSYSCSD